MGMMILLIDNYDSFTYNLVQALASSGVGVRVFRNDAMESDAIGSMSPDAIVISPGPCTPREAGISVNVVKEYSGRIPILGVCLGHQSIGVAFGATVSQAGRIMHGKISMIRHNGAGLYAGLANPFPAGRYHSLAVLKDSLPPELVVEATSEDNEIMGMRHRDHPTYGVQFHPESILTPSGKSLLKNFLRLVDEHKGTKR